MFIDSVELLLSSGKGGSGAVSFRREKFVAKGGPDGGDGGRGGDVYFEVDKNTHTLSHFRGIKHIKAKNGEDGSSKKRYGKAGKSVFVKVPPGTTIIDLESNEVLFDLLKDGQKVKFLSGGKGGLGNWHFKSSTNQRPTYAQPGLPGESKKVKLELRLIADVGLVGFPNVGKSTLISSISNATPEIANYEFTTLTPKLGVVKVGEYSSFVMADIPGIIEKASEGKGLGIEFLKHIKRSKFLLFMLDIANYRSLKKQYKILKKELKNFSNELYKREFAIAITKIDALTEDETKKRLEEFFKAIKIDLKSKQNSYKFDKNLDYFSQEIDEYNKELPFFIAPISSISRFNIPPLKYALQDVINRIKDEEISS